MFRRRLMRQTGIFLLGSLAFPYISQIYPPLDLDLILVFFGLIFFGALTLAIILERRARNHQEIELMKRVYNGFIPLPWILAATLFVNVLMGGSIPRKMSFTIRQSWWVASI